MDASAQAASLFRDIILAPMKAEIEDLRGRMERVEGGHNARLEDGDIASIFRIAYGRAPTSVEVERISSLMPKDKQALGAVALRRITAMFDRASHPTIITGRFAAEDLAVVDMGDFKMVVDTGDWAVGQPIANGAYEPHVTAFARKHIRTGMAVVDIGANIGLFTMLAAQCVGPSGRVLAFEPNSENCRLILLNAQENGFGNIELHPLALSNSRGSLFFSPGIGSNGGLMPSASETLRHPNCMVVACDRLDSIGPSEIHYIKADIEGAEYLAFRGAENTIRRDRPIITTEFSLEMLSRVSGVEGVEFLNWLVGLGYRAFLLSRETGEPQVIADIDEFMSNWGDPFRIEDLAFIPR